jgi:hypothetical protein
MRIFCIGILLVVLSGNANCQTDSIRKVLTNNFLIKALDSASKALRNKDDTEIINFGMFRYSNPYGVIIWKEQDSFRGIKIHLQKSKVKKKKIKSSIIYLFVNSPIVSDKCDLVEKLRGDKKTYFSHDFPMYLKRKMSTVDIEIYFTYSTYLSYKDSCIGGLKYLMGL